MSQISGDLFNYTVSDKLAADSDDSVKSKVIEAAGYGTVGAGGLALMGLDRYGKKKVLSQLKPIVEAAGAAAKADPWLWALENKANPEVGKVLGTFWGRRFKRGSFIPPVLRKPALAVFPAALAWGAYKAYDAYRDYNKPWYEKLKDKISD